MSTLTRYLITLLLCAVLIVTEFEALWALIVVPIMNVIRAASLRVVLKFLALLFIAPWLSPRQRKKLKKGWAWLKEYSRRESLKYWDMLPHWLRIPLACVAAFCSGVLLLTMSVVPFKTELMIMAGSTFRDRVIPFLARVAAARGIVRATPGAWVYAPHTLRMRIVKLYVYLWWWTMWRFTDGRLVTSRHLRQIYLSKLKSNKEHWVGHRIPGID